MKTVPEFKSEDRNASNFLSLSLRFAEEYLEGLQSLYKRHSETDIQLSKELTTIHRALWTSLVVEVRKLFGKSFKDYKNHSLKEIKFFDRNPYKQTIDNVYGAKIVQSILDMSNSFTVHLGQEKKFVSAEEICDSNLDIQLKKLRPAIEAYAEYARGSDPDPEVR
ncbi:hypothetical protein FJY94_06430 [Candidatus Kaiserbacteria bacterium]|nr:hypothetical protein [Candidatus Kaiserbacteria bacterium]